MTYLIIRWLKTAALAGSTIHIPFTDYYVEADLRTDWFDWCTEITVGTPEWHYVYITTVDPFAPLIKNTQRQFYIGDELFWVDEGVK